MERNDALDLLKAYLKDEKLLKHSLAVEALMKALARELGENEKAWGLAGLLHDIDYEIATKEEHGIKACEILKGKVSEEVLEAIKKHNFENNGSGEPETAMEKALIACDALSGLIVATALVMPSKKLEEVKLESLKKKFKQKDFARSVSRERIKLCESLGIPLERFLGLGLGALKSISDELGL